MIQSGKRRQRKLNTLISMSTIGPFVICIVIVVFMALMVVSMNVNREANESAVRTAEGVSEAMEDILVEAERICKIVGGNYDVQAMVRTSRPQTLVELARERTEINGKITMMVQSDSFKVDDVCIILDDGRKFKYSVGMFSLNPYADLTGVSWYRRTRMAEGFTVVGIFDRSITLNSLEWKCLACAMPCVNPKTNEVCGIVVAEIGMDRFMECLKHRDNEDTGVIVENLSDGEELLRLSAQSPRKAIAEAERTVGGIMRVRVQVGASHYMNRMNLYMLGVAAVLTAACVLMLLKTSSHIRDQITKPIENLLGHMQAFENNRIPERCAADTGILEMDRLVGGFWQLVDRIQIMIATREQEQKEIRRAQVAALQAQINPHFLYNTLESIVWLISIGQSDKAKDTLYAFARIFRIALSNGRSFISVDEELEYVENYVDVLNVRYNNQISMEIVVEDAALRESYLPKLLLQPIVENAIEHGINGREDQCGRVRIELRGCPQGLRFVVSDDGVGISEEQLKRITDRLSEDVSRPGGDRRRSGYGVFNVHNRLRLSFGREYGLSFESAKGAGTKVTLVCPICNEKGEMIR